IYLLLQGIESSFQADLEFAGDYGKQGDHQKHRHICRTRTHVFPANWTCLHFAAPRSDIGLPVGDDRRSPIISVVNARLEFGFYERILSAKAVPAAFVEFCPEFLKLSIGGLDGMFQFLLQQWVFDYAHHAQFRHPAVFDKIPELLRMLCKNGCTNNGFKQGSQQRLASHSISRVANFNDCLENLICEGDLSEHRTKMRVCSLVLGDLLRQI